MRVELTGERIQRLAPLEAALAEDTGWLWPSMIDSHVHLAFWGVADQLAASGIAAAVDLSAPERTLAWLGGGADAALRIVFSGPMLTREDGYPLKSWGKDGYGIACRDAAAVTAAIDQLAARGARVIKLALDDNGLAPALVEGAVRAAHARQLKVAVHAMSAASVELAGRAGADLLAHTPIQPLPEAAIAAWRGRAVISTLEAFGGSDEAIGNLRKLRAAGATVLYGTDLGNARVAGPNAKEIELLRRAGLDDAAITDAMTTTPAAYWGFELALTAGAEASLLVLAGDPRRDVSVLLAPRQVWLRGRRVR